MAKCLNCGNEFEAKRATAKYCSAKCRKLAFQKDGKVSVLGVSVLEQTKPEHKVEQTITDAVGKVHQIDFEGRRRDYELLESWAEGTGTEYQRLLGMLARHYRDKGFNLNRYLGVAV